MKSLKKVIFGIGSALSVLTMIWGTSKPATYDYELASTIAPADSDTLVYPFRDRIADSYSDDGSSNPMYMKDPSNIKTDVQYDVENNRYNINENMGELFYRNPSYLTFDEFVEKEFKKTTKDYWKQRAGEEDELNKKAFAPKITINSVVFDRIFGGNTIDIRPQGNAELSFGVNINKSENPAIPLDQRTVTTFDFKEKIQMNVIANIGDKMKLTTNYNTEATFDFENKMKIEYTGYEDDIIKKIEAGNITLTLPTQLIQGSQGLFGLKTQLQFGKLMVTGVFSQNKTQAKTVKVEGGAQTSTFEIKADQYEDMRHFFLAQYFKDTYDANLRDLNRVSSSVNITRIEVWITNRQTISTNNQNRNIFAFADLGETNPDPSQSFVTGTTGASPIPSDNSNDLYSVLPNIPQLRDISNVSLLNALSAQNFLVKKNYETVGNARLLAASEYTLNANLGYISLNSKLKPNDVLAVAFEYTINGVPYHVGELTSQTNGTVSGTEALFVKLIHSTNFSPKVYTWDLMMKNIYSLGGYNIAPENFRLDVLYQDDRIGGNINYIGAGCDDVRGVPLIKLFNLDDINTNGDPQPDGVFDWVDGITINKQSGRIIFPVREPFGSYLRSKFCASDGTLPNRYAYDALYDSTKTAAQQQPEKNKFTMKGTYQSSTGSDIPLNAVNIPQGSVKVMAGAVQLVENTDYTVDYTLGRVKILNESYLRSNTPLEIKLESNSLFNLQTKTILGTRLEYTFNKDFQIGGTFMHMYERPLTQKVNVGDEPASNVVWGLDGNYRRESRFLTKLLDKLPFYSTKEVSTLTFSGEIAQLIPGHSGAIGKAGTSYVDDFEGAITPLDMKSPSFWYLASVPEGQTEPAMFPEGSLSSPADTVVSGLNRAKIAWYYIDPLFQRTQNSTPSDINADDQSNNYVREVPQAEIFPNKSNPNGPQTITCLNVAYYPSERGPYNYDVFPTPVSRGLNINGALEEPDTRWGGIMRKIETVDFESNNIEFIQFWMMDPFADSSLNNGTGGDLYFNIGSLSEDILKDNHKSFENGLPATGTNNYTTENSPWGVYPTIQSIVNAFDNNVTSREQQDVGLDGLSDANEANYFSTYLDEVQRRWTTTSGAYLQATDDPSADNYKYFLADDYTPANASPLERYKRWNGMEGNSIPNGNEVSQATNYPDIEDINRDNNMNTGENYFQYKVVLKPGNMIVGQNYITDAITTNNVSLANNTTGSITWYQFKIPIKTPDKTIGTPELTNVEFIRMFMKDFETPVICRFAKLEFLRGEWRRYNFSLLNPGEYSPTPETPGSTSFDISSVSIEENGARKPINYVLPPGIEQERDLSAPALATLNEQSLSLRVCELEDGDARGAYRNTQFDFRAYKKLKMFIHAESNVNTTALNNGDMHVFVRIGSDFNENYYEYDLPLIISPSGTLSPSEIWPEGNNLEIDLEKLITAKLRRNNEMTTNSTVTLLTPFTIADGDRTITVKGTPNLAAVRSIMIGIRNPKDPNGTGQKICGEVWVNELRLSDFNEEGGWAATAKMSAKLADLGTFNIAGFHSTAGWGALESKVSERDKFDKSSYELSTSIELGKFLPEKSGIKIPAFFSYSEEIVKPQYNPLDPDVLLTQAIDAAPNPEAVDKINQTVTEYTQKKSYNFTQVRKVKTKQGAKPHIYDVENLNFNYAYTEEFQRNYNTEYYLLKTYSGAIGYNFSSGSKPFAPFEKSKSKTLSSNWLRLIKDVNINPLPSALNFRAQLDRTYSESQLRNNSGQLFILTPTYIKTFLMTRTYGLNWDLTKSLKLDFNANARAIIDEPIGKIDTEEERDSIRTSLKNLGRLKDYHHGSNATYNVPFNKLPLTDFVSGSVRYGAEYNWTGRDRVIDTTGKFVEDDWGNTISNSQTWTYNASLTFATLYNKIPYLKKINSPTPPKPVAPKPKIKLPSDSLKTVKDSTEKKESIFAPIVKGVVKTLMMIKTATGSYSETNGILLPGFKPRPDWIGQDWNYSQGVNAPGVGFLFGSQEDPRPDAIRYNWLTKDTSLNSFYTTTKVQALNLRATVEPVKSFKIELTATRNFTLNHNEYYKYSPTEGIYQSLSPTETGTFSTSYLTWNTHFVTDAADYSNKNFTQFVNNIQSFSNILGLDNPNPAGSATPVPYAQGYGQTQQDAVTYSFLSAYSGRQPSRSLTKNFRDIIPMPNWRVTYDGLSKLKFVQSFLQSLTISHGYRSVFSVNSFSRNLLYQEMNNFPSALDTAQNFIPKYDIQQITISEQLAPLIGFDMTWKNSLQTRFEIKRDRTITLAYSNIQVTEVRGIEYTIGLGYKFKRVTLPFKIGGKKKLSNDMTVKVDLNLRENTTILRKVIEGTNQPSAGTKTLSVKVSADYPVNDRFNVRAFYDFSSNEPFTSTSYPTSYTNAGIAIRFTLAQ
ncbi:MAG: cell surface protein SprA [Bacteroidetes bacterium]|nr:cell surface protein SprA [Bacteroidota bacterium]MBP6427423.1 cell surface protein SprA [Bacteroidia bacterium]